MRRVFVDSSGFFGLIVHEDAHHEHAHELFARANSERWRLVTTNAVIYEAHALLLNRSRPGRENALRMLGMLEGDKYQVERVRKTDEERAIALLRGQSDKGYSFCDALSFVIMERLGANEAIAFDRHFREYGRLTVL